MRYKFSDLLLAILLFVFVNAFPVDLLQVDLIWQLTIQTGLRLLLLAYFIYILIRNRINLFKFANYRRGLLFIPFLLVCFSNIIAALIAGSEFTFQVDAPYLSVLIIYHLFGVIIEEIVFRFMIQSSLIGTSSIKRILASAGIFALFHFINIVNVSSVDDLIPLLIQVVYSFGLGILLGFTFEYTYSIPLCVAFHFLFNFFNMIFVKNIFNIYIPMIPFYLTAVVIGVMTAAYAFLIYYFILRKTERYFSE